MSSAVASRRSGVSRLPCEPSDISGCNFDVHALEKCRTKSTVRAACPLCRCRHNTKKTTPKPIEISIIVVLKGALAYTSLGEEHRKP